MTDIAIRLDGISKKYTIGKKKDGSLRGTLADMFSKRADISTDFWALKDISFEMKKGEVLGIIGKNGAGKSTLLKILSKITRPTTGRIAITGRVSSLLEVGTGFHPELTGRENIYLNGTILGMTKREVKEKFDEIVAFSGVEKFIDTPVKHFSSGMYVRLAFAVAAHLEPEILIIDEVLSVGDAEFQKKSIGKMQSVANQGRTVLFVSHNLPAVSTLCNRGIVLKSGNLDFHGNATEAISHYLSNAKGGDNFQYYDDIFIDSIFHLNSIKCYNEAEDLSSAIIENKKIYIETDIDFLTTENSRYHLSYVMYNEGGQAMFSFYSEQFYCNGNNKVLTEIPKNFLQPGRYSLYLYIVIDKKRSITYFDNIFSFDVVDGGREMGVYMGREPGDIRPNFKWYRLNK